MNKFPPYEQILNIAKEHWQLQYQHWLYDDFRKWTWWLQLVVGIIPLLIWWKIVDRKRLLEIIVYGLLVNVTSIILDTLGYATVIWDYPDRFLPALPSIIPIDVVVVPVTFMIVYQYCNTWKSFVTVITGIALLYAFVAEPLMVALNLYTLIHWKYIYSFPIYIVMAVVLRMLTKYFVSKNHSF